MAAHADQVAAVQRCERRERLVAELVLPYIDLYLAAAIDEIGKERLPALRIDIKRPATAKSSVGGGSATVSCA